MPIDLAATEVLEALDPEQRAAAEISSGPVCILAGAGTGKTRAVTHRIAHAVRRGAVQPGNVLAVTFTTRAASEMRSRLRILGVEGVQTRTFHSAALRQLQYFWPRIAGRGFPEVAASKLPALGAAVARCRLSADRVVMRDLASEIEWAKARIVAPERYPTEAAAARRTPPLPADEVAKVYAAYVDVCRERGQVDFEDLLMVMAAAIEEHGDVAAEVRARYRHFTVDEYQDVNPLQQRLLDGWLGGRDDVCVVGDPNQTIYSFTGASPSYLLEFPRRYPGASVVRLVRDYRSSPQVVELANRLVHDSRLVAQAPAGPQPAFVEYADEPAEAAGVAARCRQLIASGVPPREIAVLFRMNAQSAGYEAAFADADVPYVLRGGERFFDRPEVREAVVLLRGAARSPAADRPASLAEAVGHVLSAAGWSPEPPAGTGAVRERWGSLQALVMLAEEMPDGADLPAFAVELESRAQAQHAPPVDGVTLASLHSAKGLEWDAVFLVGLLEGVVPISHASSEDEIAEERRLLYVGITRARRWLELSWASARVPGGRRGRVRSRFLDGLAPETRRPQSAAGERRAKGRSVVRCKACGRPVTTSRERILGRCEGCAGPVDDELFERLRAWRLERARELGQPAFCVFTDATLSAIAQSRPGSLSELGQVPGIGPSKLAAYGAEVLGMLAS